MNILFISITRIRVRSRKKWTLYNANTNCSPSVYLIEFVLNRDQRRRWNIKRVSRRHKKSSHDATSRPNDFTAKHSWLRRSFNFILLRYYYIIDLNRIELHKVIEICVPFAIKMRMHKTKTNIHKLLKSVAVMLRFFATTTSAT